MNLPLLGKFSLDRVLAFDRVRSTTAAQFLADVAALAAQLPARAHVLNDCADRYHFMVGFAAAMKRNQVSLLPSSRVEHVWRQLVQDYPDSYVLTDQRDVPAVAEVMFFPPLEAGESVDLATPGFPEAQLAAVAFTSGSTGRPKPVLKYWGSVAREAQAAGLRLTLDPGRAGAIVATVPPQHMYGFLASVLLPLQFGHAVTRERPFYPEDVRIIAESSPVKPALVITPVQLRACVLERTRLPPLSFVLSSAAPLPSAVAREAETLFEAPVLEFYGSTETGAIASRRHRDTDSWRTFDGVRVRSHMQGFLVEADYFREPVVLSDVVEILNAREFRLVGRDSDLVKIGGKRTSLLYLNQQLQELPGVVDGAFLVEEAKDDREPRLTAFVVAPGQSRDVMLAALRTRIDEVFVPRRLWLVASLPRNAAGKLPREQMLKLLETELAREAASGNT